ncbi:small ribosomal subunit protein mS37 [Centruroides vittatus]|uniref:small ribosomal subunit protein mS37 n=1 Tax=Centruroides vittatus TaxID=120091 RepID=UPI00351093C9
MTRLTAVLMGNGRRPALPPIKFREMLPLALKDKVSGKGSRFNDVACLNEVLSLLSCFEKGEFNETFCKKEIDSLQNCYLNHLASVDKRKKQQVEGKLVPGQKLKDMTAKQIDNLLKAYPIPKN